VLLKPVKLVPERASCVGEAISGNKYLLLEGFAAHTVPGSALGEGDKCLAKWGLSKKRVQNAGIASELAITAEREVHLALYHRWLYRFAVEGIVGKGEGILVLANQDLDLC